MGLRSACLEFQSEVLLAYQLKVLRRPGFRQKLLGVPTTGFAAGVEGAEAGFCGSSWVSRCSAFSSRSLLGSRSQDKPAPYFSSCFCQELDVLDCFVDLSL